MFPQPCLCFLGGNIKELVSWVALPLLRRFLGKILPVQPKVFGLDSHLRGNDGGIFFPRKWLILSEKTAKRNSSCREGEQPLQSEIDRKRYFMGVKMNPYLQASEVIDWQHPTVSQLAGELATGQTEPIAIAQVCFQWVRDEIRHNCDYQVERVTCNASEVLQHKAGFCYAKSHLLAALLRANGIPAGFCYQRLSIDDRGAPYCLHGLNAIALPGIGWYRVDPRGNRPGIDAQFVPPQEQLAYHPSLPGEADFAAILPEPLPRVVQALQTYRTLSSLRANLPDLLPEQAAIQGLQLREASAIANT